MSRPSFLNEPEITEAAQAMFDELHGGDGIRHECLPALGLPARDVRPSFRADVGGVSSKRT